MCLPYIRIRRHASFILTERGVNGCNSCKIVLTCYHLIIALSHITAIDIARCICCKSMAHNDYLDCKTNIKCKFFLLLQFKAYNRPHNEHIVAIKRFIHTHPLSLFMARQYNQNVIFSFRNLFSTTVYISSKQKLLNFHINT